MDQFDAASQSKSTTTCSLGMAQQQHANVPSNKKKPAAKKGIPSSTNKLVSNQQMQTIQVTVENGLHLTLEICTRSERCFAQRESTHL